MTHFYLKIWQVMSFLPPLQLARSHLTSDVICKINSTIFGHVYLGHVGMPLLPCIGSNVMAICGLGENFQINSLVVLIPT